MVVNGISKMPNGESGVGKKKSPVEHVTGEEERTRHIPSTAAWEAERQGAGLECETLRKRRGQR